MNTPSRQQLARSGERRVKSLMVRTLEKFESLYPAIQRTREAGIFKGDIKTMFNDVIRAHRDELNDYEIDYRPMRVTNDDRLALTRTFMSTVQRVEFDFTTEQGSPTVKVYAHADNLDILRAIRSEFNAGVIYASDTSVVLEIVGLQDCVKCVLPIMDSYGLHTSVQKSYQSWRRAVVRDYRSKA